MLSIFTKNLKLIIISIGAASIALSIWVAYNKGYAKAETEYQLKLANAQVEANKKREELEHEIIRLPDSDLDARLMRWYRD